MNEKPINLPIFAFKIQAWITDLKTEDKMGRNGNITLLPIGGLANRMRAIASTVYLCRLSGSSLNVYWFRDKGLNSSFASIFGEIETGNITIHEDSLLSKLLYDHPRKHNLWLPLMPQKALFRNRAYDYEMNGYNRDVNTFMNFLSEGNLYISSCYPIIDFPEGLFSELFRPVPEIQAKIDSVILGMSDYRIGVHVRRTDHSVSINNSPNELFYRVIDEELLLHPSLSIYLATDSESVKSEFKDRYGDRIYCSSSEADRNSVSGIKEAVSEMYILSKTDKIFGSCGSSYSEVASALGNIPLMVLKK